jgi:hypothetical protein
LNERNGQRAAEMNLETSSVNIYGTNYISSDYMIGVRSQELLEAVDPDFFHFHSPANIVIF